MGAIDLTFYLYNPVEPLFEVLVTEHRLATREQLERVVEEVFPSFRGALT